MAEAVTLATHLDDERSRAIRLLLAAPLLDAAADPDGFRLVVRHHAWLAEWFETTCGWSLAVDAAGGFGRLDKRAANPDPTRPLHRTRGSGAPFDRRRYQLLCLVCAALVRHPVTTVNLLAGTVGAAAQLDTTRRSERSAFVDALRALMAWGALTATAGDVDAYADHERGNAILSADTARLHRLLATATAPSSLPDAIGPDAAADALLTEPRYGDAPHHAEAADEEQRLRWVRHTLARRLLDDPVAYLDELTPAERDYLANPAGRRWLRERVAAAGFELEERAEGLLAVDPSATATDRQFPAPHGNAHQLALLLADRLLDSGPGGDRRPSRLSPAELRRAVDDLFERFPAWARTARDGDGPDRLAGEAVELLVEFGLARRGADGSVWGCPALARYRAGEPVVSRPEPGLFEELP